MVTHTIDSRSTVPPVVSDDRGANLAALLAQGRLKELVTHARRRIAAHGADVQAWFYLGRVSLRSGNFARADHCFRTALAHAPDNPVLLLHAAENCFAWNRFSACCLYAEQALALSGRLVAAWLLLGEARRLLLQYADALFAFQTALLLDPEAIEAYNGMALIYQEQGRYERAMWCYRHCLELEPTNAVAHNNLGTLHRGRREYDRAVRCYREAIRLDPAYATPHRNLASLHQAMGCFSEAVDGYRHALALSPRSWETYSGLLFCLSHDESADPEDVVATHLGFGQRLEAVVPVRNHLIANPNPDRVLKVGFVSADLRDHAVAYFIEPFWKALNPDLFRVYAYFNHWREDRVTLRLRDLTDTWINVRGMGDEELEQCIRNDGIDILFDLSGHTEGNRLPLFARRPAPIQITWIGYPNTTGMTTMDYRIVDQYVAPPGLLDSQFTERLLYVPSAGTFSPALEQAPPVGELPALRQGFLTFASFNRPAKIGEAVIALWSSVLNALPDSRFLIGAINDAGVQTRIRAQFAARGVASHRLEFRPVLPLAKYLELHNEVDIILDTFPYTSGTTANHALWMGVPVLTLAGRTMPQRLTAAHLGRAGLGDWVTDTPDAFLDMALFWARNLDELACLRLGMREQLLSAPDRAPQTVARGVEDALRRVWRAACCECSP